VDLEAIGVLVDVPRDGRPIGNVRTEKRDRAVVSIHLVAAPPRHVVPDLAILVEIVHATIAYASLTRASGKKVMYLAPM